MVTAQLPGLSCPFPGNMNPFVKKSDLHTASWVRKLNLVTDHSVWQGYQQQKFTWMVARMFPNASLFALNIASDFNTLLFLWDDEIDRISGDGHSEGFEMLVRRILDILKGKSNPAAEAASPILIAMRDIWKRMQQLGDTPWQQRFAKSLQAAFTANSWRMQHVTDLNAISLEEYMEYRPGIGGANFFVDLAEIMENVHLPEHYYADPLVKKLAAYCSRTICWANDIFSFPKELEQGDELNLVMMMKNKKQLPLEDAITAAVAVHDNEIQEFLHTAEVLLALSPASDRPLLGRYILMLEHMMEGNISWSTKDTIRYNQLQLVG
ncbi:MAG TPA: hypothetical protein VM802_07220 [Chitinophaga sp.]|uniref:terpene synthase family protein n=1 Tax=Chitinophaga sp. TaxID=1869181 RepID=UPI002B739987|nr:hypothetical protein [Chitinophaga sp.]HVI44641.1 hypothetical protein [Chitinophaga sp.]